MISDSRYFVRFRKINLHSAQKLSLIEACTLSKCCSQPTKQHGVLLRKEPVWALWGHIDSVSACRQIQPRGCLPQRLAVTRNVYPARAVIWRLQNKSNILSLRINVSSQTSNQKTVSHPTLTTPAGSQLAGRTDVHLQKADTVCHPLHFTRTHARYVSWGSYS